MARQPYHISVESVRWRETLPSLHLFDTFRLAIHPSKMLVAFALVALLYLGGLGLDLLWADDPFQASIGIVVRQFHALIESALGLDLGLSVTAPVANDGVVGSLLSLFLLPAGFLWRNFPWYLVIYLIYAIGLIALFGGALSRMAAVHACRELRLTPAVALQFAARRYPWYLLAPLLPLTAVGILAAVLALAGLLFFNLPGLDLIGGLVFGLLLLLGAVLTVTLLGLLVGVHLLYPAISVEGADAFDAISRGYNYVLGRLGRYFVYALISIIYFALTYLLIALVIYATLWLTDLAVGWGALANETRNVDRYQQVLAVASGRSGGEGTMAGAGWLVGFWRTVLLLILPAYVFSFYYSACTWIYLLLRRSADQVYFDDLYLPGSDATPEVLPEAHPEGSPEAAPATAPSAAADVPPPLPPTTDDTAAPATS